MRFNRGETLTETIIALTILAVGITIASTVTANSLRSLENARNRVIAVNIAREGIEAVRNIRDTNWLRFSGNRRHCWYFMPAEAGTLDDTCSIGSPPADMIQPGDYIAYKDNMYRWRLDDADQGTQLSYIDIDPNTDSDNKDGDNDNGTGSKDDKDLFNHASTADTDHLGSGVFENVVGPTIFSRTITIEYLNDDGTIINESSSPNFAGILADGNIKNPNRMRVTATVTWQRGTATYTAQLKTHLTDYLGRSNIDA